MRPSGQSAGLGRRLLAAAEERARALGLDEVRLYTGEPLTRNIAWYGRRGFVIDRIEELSERRLVHMKKSVDRKDKRA